MGAMLSQNLLNLVDILFVKQLGDAALAAAGLGGFAHFTAFALVIGVSVGVQAITARRYGEGERDKASRPLHAGLVIALVVGGLLTVGLWLLVPSIYPYLNQDPAVQKEGVPYLQARILGTTFVALNFAFRGFWNGIGASKVYMMTLFAMHVANAVLNYLLIFGHGGLPAMGLEGAGVGTALALGLGTVIYLIIGLRRARELGFLQQLPSWADIRGVFWVSLPSSIQQLFFAGGLLAMTWIIGLMGTEELAASNILINLLLVALLPGLGLGLGSATLVGQALGRQEPTDAYRWGWESAGVGFALIAMIALPMILTPGWILLPFSPDSGTVELARWPMRLIGIFIPFDVAGLILFQSLLGAGDTRRAMMLSLFFQWVFFLPLAYLSGPYLGGDLTVVWALQGLYRLLQMGFCAWLWYQRKWVAITL
jgi:putative MATE family efflux protein